MEIPPKSLLRARIFQTKSKSQMSRSMMLSPTLLESMLSPTTVVTLLLLLPLFDKGTRRLFESWWAKFQLMLTPAVPSTENPPTVSGLYIYPVKSLQAVELDIAEVDAYGFVKDRRLMLVCPCPTPAFGFLPTDATHRFITQRQCPQLATVTATYSNDNLLLLSCQGKTVTIHLQNGAVKQPVYRARLWDNIVKVVDMGDLVATFFQEIVGSGQSFRGIRLAQQVSALNAPDIYVPPEARTIWGRIPKSSLTDGFPILIACEASLDEVNRRLREKGKEPIPMSRFRPNLVIRNTAAFEEDTWKVIQIGSTQFHIVKGCPRCKQACTDQKTGQVFDEPLATLADFRAVGNSKDDVYFAQNAIAYGTFVSKGDVVKILKTGDPVWDKHDVKPE
jgi:uncharacterized protein